MPETDVTLREITAATVRMICALEPKEHQKRYVASNAVSIAQAYFEPSARFRAVYADETPVGFAMWKTRAAPGVAYLWRFMIDLDHQQKGYGRAALQLLLQALRSEGASSVTTSFVPGEAEPRGFYTALGFKETGETIGNGEIVMARPL